MVSTSYSNSPSTITASGGGVICLGKGLLTVCSKYETWKTGWIWTVTGRCRRTEMTPMLLMTLYGPNRWWLSFVEGLRVFMVLPSSYTFTSSQNTGGRMQRRLPPCDCIACAWPISVRRWSWISWMVVATNGPLGSPGVGLMTGNWLVMAFC